MTLWKPLVLLRLSAARCNVLTGVSSGAAEFAEPGE